MVKPVFKIIWDRKALDHFKDILLYLQKQSDQAPKIVKNAVIARLDLIKSNPLICEPDELKNAPNTEIEPLLFSVIV